MEQKLQTNLSLTINKGLSLDVSTLSDKFVIPSPLNEEEPKMVILVKPNNSDSEALF